MEIGNQSCLNCENESKIETIKDCGHTFCKNCLKGYIKARKVYPVKCPANCSAYMTDDMCYKILAKEDHAKYAERRRMQRCIENKNIFPCYNLNCCSLIKVDGIFQVLCQRCGMINCYQCFHLHEVGETCEMWREKNKERLDEQTKQKLENEIKIKNNIAIYCPKCKVFIEYLGGCDWLSCPRCQHEICFRTKMSRRDTNEQKGCQCLFDGVTKCHPDCNNCH